MKEISSNVIHTVDFIQGAITIILALALGEALKLFVTPHEEKPLLWDRLPMLLAFLVAFFPFFQGMSQYLYLTYLNRATAAPFYPGYLLFDALMLKLEAACFFVMSRAIAPKHWRHFYGAVLVLMVIDIAWTALTLRRGIHVGAWLYLDILVAAGICVMFFVERGRELSQRPVYIGLALLSVSTAISYWLERDIYFP